MNAPEAAFVFNGLCPWTKYRGGNFHTTTRRAGDMNLSWYNFNQRPEDDQQGIPNIWPTKEVSD
jgi:hypothetical protein